MNTRDEATLNARARMTPEERDADIAREIFGPGFYSLFGAVKAPDAVESEEGGVVSGQTNRVDALADIGQKSVDFVEARRARMAARRARTEAAIAFYDEHGTDAAYDDESEHRRGYSKQFIEATCELQAKYEAALKVETSRRERLYAAVRKHVKTVNLAKDPT